MQTKTAASNKNPLLKESSTFGVPFWQILASTTGGLLTPARIPSGASPAKAQDRSAAKSGQGTDATAANSGQTAEATAQANAQSSATTPSRPGKVAMDTALLAHRIVSSVTRQIAARQPDPSESDAGSDASQITAAGAIIPAISVPAQIPVPVIDTSLPSSAAKASSVGNATDSQTTPAAEAMALSTLARSAARMVPQLTESKAANTADVQTAMPAASASIANSADSPNPSQGAAAGTQDSQVYGKRESIARCVTLAGGASFQTTLPLPLNGDHAAAVPNGSAANLSGTDGPSSHNAAPQPDGGAASASTPSQPLISRTNAAIPGISVVNTTAMQNPGNSGGGAATPAALEQNTNGAAPASAAIPAAATLAAMGLGLHFPAASANSGAVGQTAQSASSPSMAGHGTTAASSSAASAKSNDTSASSDKSSHQQSKDSGAGTSGQTASSAGNPPAQHAADGGQTAAAKAIDSAAPMLQTVGHPAAPAQGVAGHSGGAVASTDATHTAPGLPADANEAPATGGINTARLIQTLGETGMQVGMRSAEFGDISIRTTVSQQQMTTQIAVDHGDLSRAIAAHVPAMQAKLGDDLGIRASIQVNQTGMSFAGGQSDASSGQQRAYGSATQPVALSTTAEPEPVRYAAIARDDDRLDIQA